MNELCHFANGEYHPLENHEDIKIYILQSLATTFSEDTDFLKKVNKLTFGLTSK